MNKLITTNKETGNQATERKCDTKNPIALLFLRSILLRFIDFRVVMGEIGPLLNNGREDKKIRDMTLGNLINSHRLPQNTKDLDRLSLLDRPEAEFLDEIPSFSTSSAG